MARELQQKFANVSLSPVIHVTRSKPDNSYYYTKEIIDAAKDFGYWANVSRHRMWVRLHLFDRFDESKTQLVFSFHYLWQSKSWGNGMHGVFSLFPRINRM